MKTKNIILTAGLLGLGYLIYNKSKLKNEDIAPIEESSGGGGSVIGGGGMIPIITNPIIAAVGIVTPITKRPRKTEISQNIIQDKEYVPSTSTTNSTTTGGVASAETVVTNPGSRTQPSVGNESVLANATLPKDLNKSHVSLRSEPILANATLLKESK